MPGDATLAEPMFNLAGTSGSGPDDLPGVSFHVKRATNLVELQTHVQAWQRLVETAIEPNPFFEPSLLLPAVEYLQGPARVEFALVYAKRRRNPAGPPVLCGLFPLERHRGWVSIWRHLHCFLGTPLVRADAAAETLATFFDYLAKDAHGAAAIRFPAIAGEGRLHQHLVELLHGRGHAVWTSTRHVRALFRRGESAEAFSLANIYRKRRHELRRLEKRLAELGTLSRTELASRDDLEPWLDTFLELESRGWKGRSATALASTADQAKFFRSACRSAFARGQLMMLDLRLDGKPIASKCNFLSGDSGVAFKIAFDEAFARYSPGALLEMYNIARLHERSATNSMDSCADPDHPMINHLWSERRTIETLWASSGRRGGDLLVSALPALKWTRAWCDRRVATARTTSNQSTS